MVQLKATNDVGKAVIRWSPQKETKEQRQLEEKIAEAHKLMLVRSFDIGKMLAELRDKHIPKGEWKHYLTVRSEGVFGFSSRTAFRYLDGYEAALEMPHTKLKALQDRGLDPARPAVLAAAQKVIEMKGARIDPKEFATDVRHELKQSMNRKLVAIDGGKRTAGAPRRKTLLFEFCSNLYESVIDASILKREMDDVRDRLVGILKRRAA